MVGALRDGYIKKLHDETDELWVSHALDMKRIKDFDSSQELSFTWKKSKAGVDHAFHATLYAFTAAKLMLAASTGYQLNLPMVSTFKVESARA
jgi:hypothetical protein